MGAVDGILAKASSELLSWRIQHVTKKDANSGNTATPLSPEEKTRRNEIKKEAKYLGCGQDEHDVDAKMHLFETVIGKTKSWIIVRETHKGECGVHSISDRPKIVSYLKSKKT